MEVMVYILKLNLALVAAWLLYRLVLRKLTFFRWNRIYLMASLVFSFLLPLLKLPRGSRMAAVVDMNGINWENMDFLVPAQDLSISGEAGIHGSYLLPLVYLTGAIILGLLYFFRFRHLHNQMRRANKVQSGPIPVFVQEEDRGSFTFFRRIYLDRHAWDRDSSHILRHELVHASQLHSIDLLLINFLCVVLWFNPFVFLLLRSVRENHEFLADEPAREAGSLHLAEYLVCLRDETIRRHVPAAVNHFKSSTIKKRIIMLTNKQTPKRKKAVYLLLIPLFSLLLVAFQAPIENSVVSPVKVLSYGGGDVPSIFPLPVEYREEISCGYGKRNHPITGKEVFHRAVDIKAPSGTSVFATAGGKVKESGFNEAWGNYVILAHGETYATRYTHLSEIKVKDGAIVDRGQVIATVGNTGLSTGPHLHYEVWKEGEHVDPSEYY